MNKRYLALAISFGTIACARLPPSVTSHYHIIHECGLLEPGPRPPAHFPVQPFQNEVTEATALVMRLVVAAAAAPAC